MLKSFVSVWGLLLVQLVLAVRCWSLSKHDDAVAVTGSQPFESRGNFYGACGRTPGGSLAANPYKATRGAYEDLPVVPTSPAIKARHLHATHLDASDVIIAFGADAGGAFLNDMWTYSLTEQDWREEVASDFPGDLPGRALAPALAFRNQLFTFGGAVRINVPADNTTGANATSYIAADDSFYVLGNRWDKVAVSGGGAISGRWGHSMTIRGSTVIIFGGYSPADGGTYFSDLLKWDLNEIAKGAVVTPMVITGSPLSRAYHAGAVYGRTFYVFGGYDGVEMHNSLWSISVAVDADTWTKVADDDLSAPRLVHAALSVRPSGLRVLATAYGGSGVIEGESSAVSYDPLADTNPGVTPNTAAMSTVLDSKNLTITIAVLVSATVLIGFVVAYAVYRHLTRFTRWEGELDEALKEGSLAVEAEKEDTPDGKRTMAQEKLDALQRNDPTEYRRQMQMKAVHDAVERGEEIRREDGTIVEQARPDLVPASRV